MNLRTRWLLRVLGLCPLVATGCGASGPPPPGVPVPIAQASGSADGLPIYDAQPGDLAFLPGIDAGFYVVTDGRGGWSLQWTGDARRFDGAPRAFDGQLRCRDGSLGNVVTQSFESDDALTLVSATEVAFTSIASTGWDGLSFRASPGPDGLLFELTVEGQRRPDLVFFLQNGQLVSPARMPFYLR
jgi:hypothetical protein